MAFWGMHILNLLDSLVHYLNVITQNMPTDNWGDREVEILLSSAFVLSTLFGGSDAHLNVVRNSI